MRESADLFSTFSCFIVVEVVERVDIVAILVVAVVVNIMTAVKVYLRCCCYGYGHAGDLILHCSSCTIKTFLGTYCKHLRNWEQRVASWSSRWSLHSHIQTHLYTHTLFSTLTLDHDQSPQPHVDGLWGHRYRHTDTSCCTNNQELQPRANFTNSKYCLVNAKDGGGGANICHSRIERMTSNSRQPATLIQLFAFALHSRL